MPPAAITAALISALVHASWNAVLKGGRDRLADSFLVGLGGLILACLVILLLGAPPPTAWPFLIASALVQTLYWFALLKGYEAGDLSHVYTLARGAAPPLVALGAALTAHEIPAQAQMGGIALVSLGVLCVGVSPNAPWRATAWALVIGVCIASYSLIDALGARNTGDAVLYVAWTTLMMSMLLVIVALWRRGAVLLLRQARANPWRGLSMGMMSMGGYGLVLWAQTFAPIASVTALRETSVVFGALIAWLVLKERLDARRWFGVSLAACGAALLAMGAA